MTVRVRRAGVDDLLPVLALINDPTSVHNRTACRHHEAPEDAGELHDRLAEDDNLVLEADGRVVAYVSWQWYGDHAHLNVMAVSGRHQRAGHGTAIFDALVATLRRERATGLSLRAYADSPWAIAFYGKRGMARVTGPTPAGLRPWLKMEMAEGRWPSAEKVLFYQAF